MQEYIDSSNSTPVEFGEKDTRDDEDYQTFEAHPQLILHVLREDVVSPVDWIEEFLREHGARTEWERHLAMDLRMLATVD